jgi:hypothetical protein
VRRQVLTIAKLKFIGIFPLLYCAFIFLKFYIGSEFLIVNNIVAFLFILFSFGTTLYFLYKLKYRSFIFIFILIFLISSIITLLFSSNYRMQDLILIFSYIGIGIMPIFHRLNHFIYKIFAFLFIAYFLYLISNNVDANEVFNASRNFISIFLLILVGYHIISSYQNQVSPSFLLIVLCFVISIWSVGRGGILTFAFLTVFYPFVTKMKIRNRLVFLILFSVALYYVFYFYGEYIFSIGFARFQSMGIQDSRTDINAEYISVSLTKIQNLMFGSPFGDVISIRDVEGNPHNSFIRLHVYFGIIGVILFFSTFILSLIRLLKMRAYLLVYLFFALLLRAFTDSAAFHGVFDPLIYYLLFYPLMSLVTVDKTERPMLKNNFIR